MKGNQALAALWDALEEDRKPPPPNAITAYDYMDKFHTTLSSALGRLNGYVESGMMASGKFWSEKRKRSVKFYWLPKKAKK